MKIPRLKEKLITCGIGLALIVAMYLLKLPCPFQYIFGIDCPGCGMTRAYISLLRLDLGRAFAYHGMFWSVPVLGLVYLFDGKLFKPKWLNDVVEYSIYGGFFVHWLIKLFL